MRHTSRCVLPVGIMRLSVAAMLIAATAPFASLAAQAAATPRSPYAPLPTSGQWVYRLNIPTATQIPVHPEWKGVIGSNVTHGMLRRNAGSWPLIISIVELTSPSVAKATIGKELNDLLFAPAMTETRLQLSPRSKSLLVLELGGSVSTTDTTRPPIQLEQWLAALPADGRPKVEENGWMSETVRDTVVVPAGQFTDLIHSRIKKGAAGAYTPDHVVESWLARNVGLVKLVVLKPTGEIYYSLELESYKLK